MGVKRDVNTGRLDSLGRPIKESSQRGSQGKKVNMLSGSALTHLYGDGANYDSKSMGKKIGFYINNNSTHTKDDVVGSGYVDELATDIVNNIDQEQWDDCVDREYRRLEQNEYDRVTDELDARARGWKGHGLPARSEEDMMEEAQENVHEAIWGAALEKAQEEIGNCYDRSVQNCMDNPEGFFDYTHMSTKGTPDGFDNKGMFKDYMENPKNRPNPREYVDDIVDNV